MDYNFWGNWHFWAWTFAALWFGGFIGFCTFALIAAGGHLDPPPPELIACPACGYEQDEVLYCQLCGHLYSPCGWE